MNFDLRTEFEQQQHNCELIIRVDI
jgi:hypothetical protein